MREQVAAPQPQACSRKSPALLLLSSPTSNHQIPQIHFSFFIISDFTSRISPAPPLLLAVITADSGFLNWGALAPAPGPPAPPSPSCHPVWIQSHPWEGSATARLLLQSLLPGQLHHRLPPAPLPGQPLWLLLSSLKLRT